MNNSRRLKRFLPTSFRKLIQKHSTSSVLPVRYASSVKHKLLDAEEYQHLNLCGYTISKITEIPEYNALAVQLVHERSGAEHLHIARDDHNNVFSVAFRTVPMDSTGVPHILEHTVLCGSKRYPVRDPFFKMLNRSLQTFMNAMTASDWTIYPFATQNLKDYENLMSVYLDATFFPNLEEVDFRQEGWRLEHTDPNNPDSDIIFKGVVFNEMKGALSDTEQLFSISHQSLLLPSHTYGYESGGDPLHIPNLTWEQLKSFHASSYHPSNARFFTYGNFPLEKSLQQIHDGVLQHFEKVCPETDIPEEPKWSAARTSTITCTVDPLSADPEKQHTLSVSYMLDSITDPFQSFTLSILSALLVDGPNSPFYQALIESNIGLQYSPVLGFNSNTKNPSFGVGLQGMHEKDVQNVIDIIEETFQKVYRDGFDAERIEAILHSAELQKKHQTSYFGIQLAIGLTPYWTYGNNPVDFLAFDEEVKRFRETLIDNPSYLQDKVKEHFLDNTHKLTLIMKPDEDYAKNKELAEKKLLEEKLASLSEEDKQELYHEGLSLDKKQNEVEDISCLPKMQVSDVNKELITTQSYMHIEDNNVPVFSCEQPTNDITYFNAICTSSSLPFILMPYLPLFCKVLTKLGAGRSNHKELAQKIEMTTGGLSAQTHIVPHRADESQFELGISFSSYCLKQNIPNMFSLWQDVLNEPKFSERDHLLTLINDYANSLAMSVQSDGHTYAMSYASRHLNKYSQLSERLGGLNQVEFMQHVASDNLDETIENLMQIAMLMLNANEMRCMINTTGDQMDESLKGLEGMLASLNTVGFDDEDFIEGDTFEAKSKQTFFEMDLPINYVSKCVGGIPPYTHEDHATLQVLAKLMSAKFLHREIREKGGAYGSGARHGGGIFSFFSYRDPNVSSTLDAFDRAIHWAGEGKFTDVDIEEAKLSIFGTIDSPVSPANRGKSHFRSGLSDEIRQEHRNRLFSTSREDILAACNRYLVPGNQIESKTVIGPKNENVLKDGSWIIK